MKYLIILLLFPCIVSAQRLDTVYVRHLAFTGEQVAYLIGKNASSINDDTATVLAYNKIIAKVLATPNLTLNTVINLDSVPGRIVFGWYRTAKTSNSGEVAPLYMGIINTISSKANLAYWIGGMDAVLNSDRQRAIDLGIKIALTKRE